MCFYEVNIYISFYYCSIGKGEGNRKVPKSKNKLKILCGIEFLSNLELWNIFLQSFFIIIICIPFISGDIRYIVMLLLIITFILQLVIFCFRWKKFNYIAIFKIYLVLLFLILLVGLGLIMILSLMQQVNIFIEIVAICWMIIFFIIGFLNFKITVKFLFYWRMKKVFPYEGENPTQIEISLKKLSPYISLEKQKAYLMISYGINLIVYGFYTYFCFLVFKSWIFTEVPVLKKIQAYIFNWNFINSSNAIGLFSIFLALLSICVPAQQKIVREAEKEMLAKYNNI